jgi:hypothetical protein
MLGASSISWSSLILRLHRSWIDAISRRGHSQYGTGRAPNDSLGHASAHRIDHSVPPFGRHDDQVCIVSRLEDGRRNIAFTSQFLP